MLAALFNNAGQNRATPLQSTQLETVNRYTWFWSILRVSFRYWPGVLHAPAAKPDRVLYIYYRYISNSIADGELSRMASLRQISSEARHKSIRGRGGLDWVRCRLLDLSIGHWPNQLNGFCCCCCRCTSTRSYPRDDKIRLIWSFVISSSRPPRRCSRIFSPIYLTINYITCYKCFPLRPSVAGFYMGLAAGQFNPKGQAAVS